MTMKLNLFKKYCDTFTLSIIIVLFSFFSFVPYSDSATCTSVTISPESQNVVSSGSSEIAQVAVTESDCSWTASSNDSWIKIINGFSGDFNIGTPSVTIGPSILRYGNGTVSYSVDPNSGAARTGTITVGDKTFTVTQSEQTASTTTISSTTTSSTTTTTVPSCGNKKPKVTKLSKTKGKPGVVVKITGSNFCTSGGKVTFGNMEAEISVWNEESITVKVPAISVGKKGKTVNVKVTAANQKSSNTKPFKVLP